MNQGRKNPTSNSEDTLSIMPSCLAFVWHLSDMKLHWTTGSHLTPSAQSSNWGCRHQKASKFAPDSENCTQYIYKMPTYSILFTLLRSWPDILYENKAMNCTKASSPFLPRLVIGAYRMVYEWKHWNTKNDVIQQTDLLLPFKTAPLSWLCLAI